MKLFKNTVLVPAGFALLSIFLTDCTQKTSSNLSLSKSLSTVESIKGRKEYLNSPYVTAGDRLYVIGHQNGQFPEDRKSVV